MQTRVIAGLCLALCLMVAAASATRLSAEFDYQRLLADSSIAKLSGAITPAERLHGFAAVFENNKKQSRYGLAFAEYLETLAAEASNNATRDEYYRQAYLAYEAVLRVRPANARALLALSLLSAYAPTPQQAEQPERDATVFFEHALKQAYWDSSLSSRVMAAGFAGWPTFAYRQQRQFAFWLGKNLEQNRINLNVARHVAKNYGRKKEFSVIEQQFAE